MLLTNNIMNDQSLRECAISDKVQMQPVRYSRLEIDLIHVIYSALPL